MSSPVSSQGKVHAYYVRDPEDTLTNSIEFKSPASSPVKKRKRDDKTRRTESVAQRAMQKAGGSSAFPSSGVAPVSPERPKKVAEVEKKIARKSSTKKAQEATTSLPTHDALIDKPTTAKVKSAAKRAKVAEQTASEKPHDKKPSAIKILFPILNKKKK